MTSDPINPPERGSGTTRRTFMRHAATAAASLSVPGLLAACGTTSPTAGSSGGSSTTPMGPGGLPLARPDNPVTLPIYADNKAIASGPVAREGTAAVLQLGPVHQHRRRQGVREEVRRQRPDQHVHDDRRGGREDLQRHRSVRRVRARARVPRAARRRQGPAAAEPQLHPESQGQRVAVAAQPLVRRGRALHGSVHGLHDRNRLARRQASEL